MQRAIGKHSGQPKTDNPCHGKGKSRQKLKNYNKMKKLDKLKLSANKMLKSEELVNFRGGSGSSVLVCTLICRNPGFQGIVNSFSVWDCNLNVIKNKCGADATFDNTYCICPG